MARKKISLTKDQIQQAIDCSATSARAANLLGVSFQTLDRRCKEFGIELRKNQGGKGLTAEQRYGKEKAIALSIQQSARCKALVFSPETRKKLSDKALQRIDDGRIPSKGLKGRYNGIWFDSSWELAYYLWMKEVNGITVARNTKLFFEYLDDAGVLRRTKPDFILPNGNLVEIKGYPNIHTNAKIRALGETVIFLFYDDMKGCLSYVRKKYGREFTKTFYASVGESVDPPDRESGA